MADDDTFVRNPEIDYSGIPENPAPDPSATVEPIPSVDYGDGTDMAQDTSGESASAVSAEALAHHQETLNVVSAVDRAGADDHVADWGQPGSESFAENWGHARFAAQELSSSGLQEVLDGAGLGDHPLILQLAADIGRRLSAGGGNQGLASQARTPANIGKREAITAELDGLMRLMNTDLGQYKSPATQRKIKALTTALAGDGPIVGRASRSA